MKFSIALIALFATSSAVAAPTSEPIVVESVNGVAELLTIGKRAPGGINYEQNYNGYAANFEPNENDGSYTCRCNGNTDFVVDLG